MTIRPIVDPLHHAPEDLHDPSLGLRTAVTALMPVDVFPYASRTSRACDLDHTIPYRDGETGQTRWGNLAPLARRSHRAKTFGGWVLTQPAPGWFHWKSPAGFEYLVHATGGTMCLRTPEPEPRLEEPPPPWLDPPEPPETRPVESEAWEWIQYALC
ncbi:HNH endonuclease [Arachnia propionica]|uniref:HNH endonuclease n=1 Tax=Arachnia propionica TaxID=1750 RepID=A0A3P1WSK5_9ACTN|nr:HNH endonuclease [Arachnia propionica]